MTSINPNQASANNKFKQVEGDSWMSLYLPAICAGALMLGALLLAVSCSKKSNNTAAITAPAQPAVTNPAPSTPVAAVPQRPKKKIVKRHRPTHATYINSLYGVSFSYPRKYTLQSGDKLGAAPIPASFLKPGAMQVAWVDVPDSMYPETDFASALFNVSVSNEMTSDECMQFVPAAKDDTQPKPRTVKVGANQFSVFEQITGQGDLKSDLKYFHLFKNNACYEFALDVDTIAKTDSDLAQVDRGKVFHQLERILTTARIKNLPPIEVENASKAPATVAPATDPKAAATTAPEAQTEKISVVTPEQK